MLDIKNWRRENYEIAPRVLESTCRVFMARGGHNLAQANETRPAGNLDLPELRQRP